MYASEVIIELQRLIADSGDRQVVCQAHGCCTHGHEIMKIEAELGDEEFSGSIVIRV